MSFNLTATTLKKWPQYLTLKRQLLVRVIWDILGHAWYMLYKRISESIKRKGFI